MCAPFIHRFGRKWVFTVNSIVWYFHIFQPKVERWKLFLHSPGSYGNIILWLLQLKYMSNCHKYCRTNFFLMQQGPPKGDIQKSILTLISFYLNFSFGICVVEIGDRAQVHSIIGVRTFSMPNLIGRRFFKYL